MRRHADHTVVRATGCSAGPSLARLWRVPGTSIRADLGLTPTGLSWVQDACTLVLGGLLLPGARAGDIVGRRRLFVVGSAISAAASLLIGLAPPPAGGSSRIMK